MSYGRRDVAIPIRQQIQVEISSVTNQAFAPYSGAIAVLTCPKPPSSSKWRKKERGKTAFRLIYGKRCILEELQKPDPLFLFWGSAMRGAVGADRPRTAARLLGGRRQQRRGHGSGGWAVSITEPPTAAPSNWSAGFHRVAAAGAVSARLQHPAALAGEGLQGQTAPGPSSPLVSARPGTCASRFLGSGSCRYPTSSLYPHQMLTVVCITRNLSATSSFAWDEGWSPLPEAWSSQRHGGAKVQEGQIFLQTSKPSGLQARHYLSACSFAVAEVLGPLKEVKVPLRAVAGRAGSPPSAWGRSTLSPAAGCPLHPSWTKFPAGKGGRSMS